MTAADFLPDRKTLRTLERAAAGCRGCELYKHATQTVFGEGSPRAAIIVVGEQPGDREDREGRPFVGPAGRLFDEVANEAGLERESLYVTNAVKHFKWEPRGKRRLHKQPSARELQACRPWLDAEIEVVSPQGIVCLGATAAKALLGGSFRLTQQRGEFQTAAGGRWCLATWHPSAVLRAPEEERREDMKRDMIRDLRRCARRLAGGEGRR
jgi:DNA polymerase